MHGAATPAAGDTITDFANGNYSSDEQFPISVFDFNTWSTTHDESNEATSLARYTGDPTDPRVEGLWESSHPWAKILRLPDLNMKSNNFVVRPGFEVVCCTYLRRGDYARALRVAIPMPRMQAILPTL